MNAASPSITVGIPTYNRADSLRVLVDQLGVDPAFANWQVLVIDDASQDGTPSIFEDARPRLRHIRNARNLGYPTNFLRLFAECTTDFLIIMADDDVMIPEGCGALLQFLSTEPTLVVPQWLQNGVRYRGCAETVAIQPSELMACSGHAPGLVYQVDRCRPHLELVERRLREGCAFTSTYPQATLCLSLLLAGESCWWLAVPTATEGAALPSGINDPNGDHYSAYRSRLRQAAALDAIISAIAPAGHAQALQSMAALFYLQRIVGACSVEVQKEIARRSAVATARALILKMLPHAVKRPLKAIRNAMALRLLRAK